MKTWYVVAKREFLERVANKWFVVFTLLAPIALVVAMVAPALLAVKTGLDVDLGIVDNTGQLRVQLEENLRPWRLTFLPAGTTNEEIDRRIVGKSIDGALVIPDHVLSIPAAVAEASGVVDAVVSTVGSELTYRGSNATNQVFLETVTRQITQLLVTERARAAGLKPHVIAAVTRPTRITTQQTDGTSQESSSGGGALVLAYAMAFLLYFAVLFYCVSVMRSVVLDKSSKVVELLLSSIRPFPLLVGKIVGIGSVGLLQIVCWVVLAVVLATFREPILGLFGIQGAGLITFPTVEFAGLAVMAAYFVIGYFLYATLYAAVGAIVNSEQESQQAQMPITILLFLSVAFFSAVANDPRGELARILTMIPFSSPLLMPMRYQLGGASIGELLGSLAILVASTVFFAWLSARIFRMGLLFTGKRPTLAELARWIRQS